MIEPPRRVLEPAEPVGGLITVAGRGPRLDQVRGERVAAWLADAGRLRHVADRVKPGQRGRRVVGRQLGQAEDPAAQGGQVPVAERFGLRDAADGERPGLGHVAAPGRQQRLDVADDSFAPAAALPVPAGRRRRVPHRGVPVACPPFGACQGDVRVEGALTGAGPLRVRQDRRHQVAGRAGLAAPQVPGPECRFRGFERDGVILKPGQPRRGLQLVAGIRFPGPCREQPFGGQHAPDESRVPGCQRVGEGCRGEAAALGQAAQPVSDDHRGLGVGERGTKRVELADVQHCRGEQLVLFLGIGLYPRAQDRQPAMQRAGNLSRPLLAVPARQAEFVGEGKGRQPGQPPVPARHALLIRSQLDCQLGQLGGPGRRAARGGVLGGVVQALGERLVWLVGTERKMPGRLVVDGLTAVECGADGPVEASSLRAGQHALGDLAQQRMAEPEHGIGRACLQDARLNHVVGVLVGQPRDDPAQQRPGWRGGERGNLGKGTCLRVQPDEAVTERGGEAQRDVSRRAVLPAAGDSLPGNLQRGVGIARGQRYDLP
jgi:hypothetical protein